MLRSRPCWAMPSSQCFYERRWSEAACDRIARNGRWQAGFWHPGSGRDSKLRPCSETSSNSASPAMHSFRELSGVHVPQLSATTKNIMAAWKISLLSLPSLRNGTPCPVLGLDARVLTRPKTRCQWRRRLLASVAAAEPGGAQDHMRAVSPIRRCVTGPA